MMKTLIQFDKSLAMMLAAAIALAGCSGGDSSSSDSGLSDDTAIAYVERGIQSEAQKTTAKFNKELASPELSPLDLNAPYDFNPGARLVSRSSLDTSAFDFDVLTDYFGSSNYDVKDLKASSDGKRLVFAAHGPKDHPSDNSWNIYTFDVETMVVTRVIADDDLANAGQDTNPVITESGNVVFSSDRSAGNPDYEPGNIVEDDINCVKIDPRQRPSLLHRMTGAGEDIVQLTYGNNHDTSPTLLRDGRVAFLRSAQTYEFLTKNCSVSDMQKAGGTNLLKAGAFGLDAPSTLEEADQCAMGINSQVGEIEATNHFTILRITEEGDVLDQLYETVSVSGSADQMLELDGIVQAEDGHLLSLVKHKFNQFLGGDLIKMKDPRNKKSSRVFGNMSPESMVNDVDLYPNQISDAGWYSAAAPYMDGSERLLLSWSQCGLNVGDVTTFCDDDTSVGDDVSNDYGIWMYNPLTRSRLPVVRARPDVVYSDLAVIAQSQGIDFPYEPFATDIRDNADTASIVCTDTPVTPLPTVVPTTVPTIVPTTVPTLLPTLLPTIDPSLVPTLVPTLLPTTRPTVVPPTLPPITIVPTTRPTLVPTQRPTVVPTQRPTAVPTQKPTAVPTQEPTVVPTVRPTVVPTLKPTPTAVPNKPPVAIVPASLQGQVGETLELDGTESYDPEGEELSFQWTIVSQPLDSNPTLARAKQGRAALTLDTEGSYEVQLVVSDGVINSAPAILRVQSIGAPEVCDLSDVNKRSFRVTIRDFTPETNPDFEYTTGEEYGIVKLTLGADGKPVYAKHNRRSNTTNGRKYFNQWYNTIEGVNIEIPMSLEMVKRSDGKWEFSDGDFFPIDGLGFGNYKWKNYKHNFHFTLETHLEFKYEGGEVFTFTGDDDLWVFINGKRVIDIGGVHAALSRTISLDNLAAELGIEKGGVYSFDMFFAERHVTESNFKFQTNINLECVDEK